MPKNDQEAFTYLTGHSDSTYLINLLTYALYADEKAVWIAHFNENNNRPPSSSEIEGWVSNITDQYFDHMRLKAARFFDEASREYLSPEIEQGRREILESAIVSRVEAAGNFWRQLFMAMLTAVIAPIIIGGVIAAVLAYNKVFPTFVQVPVQSEKKNQGE